MLPMFMAVADQTIVASALPSIAASLGDVERISWIVVAYLVCATLAAPVYGYLGDVFGRRKLMFVALGTFFVASMLCAASPSIPLLAAARALQGLGGGGMMSLSQALIGEVVPGRLRGYYQSYLATVATTASVFGPVAGGFLTQHFGWTATFTVNAPLCAIAFVLVFRLPPRAAASRANFSFDGWGLVYFVLFVVPVLLALEQARRFDAQALTLMASLFAIAVLSAVLLVRREARAVSPLLPLEMFKQAPVWRANGMAMCHGAALTSLVAFLPIYFRVVHDTTASQTGLMLLPVSIAIGVGSIATGRFVTRTGQTMIMPTIGLACAVAVFLLFVATLDRLSTSGMMAILGAAALFMGTVMSVVQITVQTAAGRKHIGAAAGSVQFSRTVGAAFGTALMAAVLFATLIAMDPEAATLFGRIVDAGPAALDGLSAARRATVQAEIAFAFRAAFFLQVAFCGLGLYLAATNPLRRV